MRFRYTVLQHNCHHQCELLPTVFQSSLTPLNPLSPWQLYFKVWLLNIGFYAFSVVDFLVLILFHFIFCVFFYFSTEIKICSVCVHNFWWNVRYHRSIGKDLGNYHLTLEIVTFFFLRILVTVEGWVDLIRVWGGSGCFVTIILLVHSVLIFRPWY